MANEFIVRKGIKSLGGVTFPLTGISNTYTIQTTDNTIECVSGTFTVTLPTAIGVKGKQYVIKNIGSGTITVSTTSSQTIDGNNTISLTQNDSIVVISDDSDWKIIGGVGNAILGTEIKSGEVVNTSFTGNPKNAVVSFSPVFPNTNYSVVVTGGDARSWTIENKTTSSFVINSNSNTALDNSVYWIANTYS
jgi:hypothetical protein